MNTEKLLALFKDDKYITISDIQRRMGVGYLTAGKYLCELIDNKQVYKNKEGRCVIKKNLTDTDINIVFLDVDGVLNCRTTKDQYDGYRGIEDSKVELLKELVNKIDSKIVLVSTWKFYWYKESYLKDKQDGLANYLDQKLSNCGLTIYDKTEDHDVHNRGEGILEYIRKLHHKGIKVNKYVIFDDEPFDYLSTKLTSRLVRTSFENGGLQEKHIKKALEKMAD